MSGAGPSPEPARTRVNRSWKLTGKGVLRAKMSKKLQASAFTVPAWILLLPLVAVPLGMGGYLSVRNHALDSVLPDRFVGLQNYHTDVATETFVHALEATLVILGLGLAIQLPVGLGLALLLQRQLRGSRLFRSALIIPMLLTPVAVALMWRFMFNPELGVINWALHSVAVPRVDWLGSSTPALMAVVIVDSWQAIPFVMLLMLAGLSSLPRTPFEAAAVDGCSSWQSFRYITLPLLRPVILVTLMIRIIDGFKIFDSIFILTRGGPGTATQTVSLLDYNTAFSFLATSRAAAIGVVLALLTLPVYFLWVRANRAQ